MIVVAIIAILAAVIIANLFHARAQAQVSAIEETLRAASAAEEMYANDYGAYTPLDAGLMPTLFGTGTNGNLYYSSTPTTMNTAAQGHYLYAYTAPTSGGNYNFCTQGGPEYGRDIPTSVKKSDGSALTAGTPYDLCISLANGIYAR